MKIGHNHDDHDSLTFGCPGCIYRVAKDQTDARLAEELAGAPLREVTCHYEATVRIDGSVTVTTRIPEHWDEDQVAAHLERGDIGAEIDNLIDSDLFGNPDGRTDLEEVTYTVGARVPALAAEIQPQPDLFGASA